LSNPTTIGWVPIFTVTIIIIPAVPLLLNYIWSCRPPSLKKDNRIFGLTMGDYLTIYQHNVHTLSVLLVHGLLNWLVHCGLYYGFYGPFLTLSHNNGLAKPSVPTEYQQTICESSFCVLPVACEILHLRTVFNSQSQCLHPLMTCCTMHSSSLHLFKLDVHIVNEISAEIKYIYKNINAGTTHSRGLGGVKWA
jgi:hypothetical protein